VVSPFNHEQSLDTRNQGSRTQTCMIVQDSECPTRD